MHHISIHYWFNERCKLQGEQTGKKTCQGVWTFRQYDRTMTKSLPEEPTDAGTFFDVDAPNHRSTKLCSCNDGITG